MKPPPKAKETVSGIEGNPQKPSDAERDDEDKEAGKEKATAPHAKGGAVATHSFGLTLRRGKVIMITGAAPLEAATRTEDEEVRQPTSDAGNQRDKTRRENPQTPNIERRRSRSVRREGFRTEDEGVRSPTSEEGNHFPSWCDTIGKDADKD